MNEWMNDPTLIHKKQSHHQCFQSCSSIVKKITTASALWHFSYVEGLNLAEDCKQRAKYGPLKAVAFGRLYSWHVNKKGWVVRRTSGRHHSYTAGIIVSRRQQILLVCSKNEQQQHFGLRNRNHKHVPRCCHLQVKGGRQWHIFSWLHSVKCLEVEPFQSSAALLDGE